ncbi:hypothetical protein ONS95_014946 [Cadophora gregata]|uniref:uncharacterized protein n=1 Tax=Cadophora gregata TaxID=51156 RepID=UPI0026DD74F1|nr:uncharacterized protein ONS95_014946 [Cadophora gregata]KAK0113250.1 hypothetical protein ONS95_014946 [Cadophora gregata]
MATQEQTQQQASAQSPYDEEQDQQIVAQKSAAAAVQQPQYGAESRQYMLPPRAEGYRPAAIRESRIKDRPYKPVGDSSLSIKIELDLEVEVSLDCDVPERAEKIMGGKSVNDAYLLMLCFQVDLYARVKGDVTIGLM